MPTAPRSRSLLHWACLCLAPLLGLHATAQLPLPRLTSLLPAGATRGTNLLIVATGSDLDDPLGLVFSDPRVTGAAAPGGGNAFHVSVPPGVPPGLLDVRFAGRFGVSNPRVFVVGELPELTAPTTHNSPETAFELPLDTPCHGRVLPTQVHWFKFAAKAGQRVLVHLQTEEIDSRLVPDLAVFDDAHRELAIARRSALLDFTPSTDGLHRLRIHDQTYRGGDDFFFRLTLDTGPLVEFCVPPVVQAGTTQHLTLHGRNLPGARPGPIAGIDGRRLDQLGMEVVVPPAGMHPMPAPSLPRRPAAVLLAGNRIHLPIPLPGRPPLLIPLALTTDTVHAPPPTGTTSGSLSDPLVRLAPPASFGSLFPARGGHSGFTFVAKKGDAYWLEIFSERLGFNADPRILVQRVSPDTKGVEKVSHILELNDVESTGGGREFDSATRDASGRLAIPEDGTYRVLAQNLFNGGANAGRVPYWLALRPVSPDFELAVHPQPQPRLNDTDRLVHLWTPVLRRGETQPVRVVAFRRDGFDGAIELTATNLPSGVTAQPTRILPGRSTESLLLTAAPDAPQGQAAIMILGRAEAGGRALTHTATPASSVWPVADWDQDRAVVRPMAALIVSVCATETAPVTIAPTNPTPIEVTAGSRISIPLSLRRHDLFPAAFALKTLGHPEAEKRKDLAIPANATNAVLELDLSETKLPPGPHTLWLQALVPGNYRNNPEALTAAESDLTAATAAVASASPEAKAAAEDRRKTAEAARKAAEEKAKPRSLTAAVYSQPIQIRINPAPAGETKK